jgi:prepilin-type N-terminal cleavage/methylation domain-containing protein
MTMGERGHTLLEMLVVMGILGTLAAVGVPALRAATTQAQIVGAADKFQADFLLARSIAVRSGCQTAIRFELQDGLWYVSSYSDGNGDGVRSEDIRSGRDQRIGGPRRLDPGASDVRIGINPGVPEPPPGRGLLSVSDPIRFGRSNMVSFSPLGTATPGTFYLAAPGVQAAVRVVPGSARVRLLFWRGGTWEER